MRLEENASRESCLNFGIKVGADNCTVNAPNFFPS